MDASYVITDCSDLIPAFHHHFVESLRPLQPTGSGNSLPATESSTPAQRLYKIFIQTTGNREGASTQIIDECVFTCEHFERFAFSWSGSTTIPQESVESFGSHPPASDTGMLDSNIWPTRPDTGFASNKWLKKYRTEVAASCATLIGTTASYPLDAIKTRMQAYNPTFLQCVRDTYKLEGARAFMKGVSAPLLSVTFNRTISFSVYQRVKYAYSAHHEAVTGSSPLVVVNTPGSYPTLGTVTCFGVAGAVAGAVGAAIGCPFEFIKVSQQLEESNLRAKAEAAAAAAANGKAPLNGVAATCVKGAEAAAIIATEPEGTASRYRTTIGAMRYIIKRRGYLGLWSGFHLQVLGNTVGSSIYFMTYESSKQMLATYRGSSPTSPLPVAVAGGLCGVVSWIFVYPIDSARIMYQRDCAKFDKEVVLHQPQLKYLERRMYRGLGVNMARSFVLNAVFFSVFEAIKKQINMLEV